MVVQSWADTTVTSLREVWSTLLGFLPELIGAVVVFVLGLIVAAGLAMLVEKVLEALRLNAAVNKTGVDEYFKRGGLDLNVSRFLGRLVYWFIIVVAFLAASDVLGLERVSTFLYTLVLPFIGRIAVAVLILVVTMVAANFLKAVVRASVMGAKVHSAKFLGALAWWAVVVLGLFTALSTLGVNTEAIRIVLQGLVVMLALAGGIAFGLGGKDYAAHLVDRLKDEVGHK